MTKTKKRPRPSWLELEVTRLERDEARDQLVDALDAAFLWEQKYKALAAAK